MRFTRSEMRRYISTRLCSVRFGENKVSVEPNRTANSSRRNKPSDLHAAVAGVCAEHVGVTARIVELRRRGLHEHMVVRQLPK